MRRFAFVLAAALAVAGHAAAGAGAAELRCLTPVAADGHEPTCNPFAASSVWSTSHRGAYAQGSSAYPGPLPGEKVTLQKQSFPNEVPVILQVSDPYPDGKRALWFSTVGVPDPKRVYKIDYDTLQVLGSFDSAQADGESRQAVSSTSGVYSLMARGNRFVAIRERRLEVFTDAVPGVRTSGVRRIARFELPASALCRPSDRLVGMTLLFSGEVAFATAQGVIGVVPVGQMDAAHLRTSSINGSKCADPAVKDADLEQISNSISADEDGGVYPVTSRAMYRFDYRGGKLTRTWRAAYESGGGQRGSTLSEGSGSTPDVTGTDPDDDKFIVITDGQKLMHLVLFWRGKIPSGWKPIKPGRDRRIACEFPVTYGNPNATDSASEQSVLTRGYASVVVNNVVGLGAAFAGLPAGLQQAAANAVTPQVPGNTPHGMERIDWDPKTRKCRSVWANPDIAIPNAVPTLSTGSGLIYATSLRDTVWGLEGVDFRTGRSRLFVPASPEPDDNSFYSATTVGSDGAIFQGTIQGLNAYRTAPKRGPRLACKDITRPSSRVTRRRSRLGRRGATVRGTARDRACGRRARVKRVYVSVARVVRGGCRHMGRRGAISQRRRRCSARRFVRARMRARSGRFALVRHRRLPAGRYRVVTKAVDRRGLAERALRRVSLRVSRRRR